MNKIKKELGVYFIDISKLTFAGVVLSVILEINTSKLIVLLAGSSATFIFAFRGFLLISMKVKRSRKNQKQGK